MRLNRTDQPEQGKPMARKQRPSIVGRLGHAFGDIADAVSVAATGSQLGVLELAAEDELDIRPVKAAKKKVAVKKKAPAKQPAPKKKAAPKKAAKKPVKKVAKKSAKKAAKKTKAKKRR
jgi:hypothetical protein